MLASPLSNLCLLAAKKIGADPAVEASHLLELSRADGHDTPSALAMAARAARQVPDVGESTCHRANGVWRASATWLRSDDRSCWRRRKLALQHRGVRSCTMARSACIRCDGPTVVRDIIHGPGVCLLTTRARQRQHAARNTRPPTALLHSKVAFPSVSLSMGDCTQQNVGLSTAVYQINLRRALITLP